MYIPEYYKEENIDVIHKIIQDNPFGIIVSIDGHRPIATHIPLKLQKNQTGEYFIHGHVAKKNPQWKSFSEQDKVLLIFRGPHAYISSSWYQIDEVPTWNYQAVHVYGEITQLSQEELVDDLILLLNQYEEGRKNAKTWTNLNEETKKQLHGIVGFKVSLDEIYAVSKMSQNRSKEDYQSIINHLLKSELIEDQHTAKIMEEL